MRSLDRYLDELIIHLYHDNVPVFVLEELWIGEDPKSQAYAKLAGFSLNHGIIVKAWLTIGSGKSYYVNRVGLILRIIRHHYPEVTKEHVISTLKEKWDAKYRSK